MNEDINRISKVNSLESMESGLLVVERMATEKYERWKKLADTVSKERYLTKHLEIKLDAIHFTLSELAEEAVRIGNAPEWLTAVIGHGGIFALTDMASEISTDLKSLDDIPAMKKLCVDYLSRTKLEAVDYAKATGRIE